MKKNRDADALAARLAAAANQPPVLVPFPKPSVPEPEVLLPEALSAEPEGEAKAADPPDDEPGRKKARRTRRSRAALAEPDDDTIAMSLRPRREVLTRYVLAASERTRETGRVVSAQHIMLERLEGGP